MPCSPRGVILDLDDTLCDYTRARAVRLRTAFGIALAHHQDTNGLDLDQLVSESLEIAPHGDYHFAQVLEPHGVTDASAIDEARRWFRTNRFHNLVLFEKTVPTLRWLRASHPDRRLGIITNGPADVQRAKVELLDLESFVDVVLISGEFGAEKPDPQIFQVMMRRLGVEPSEAVMIGDSPEHDIAGAHAVDIAAIWVHRDGRQWRSPLRPPEATIRHIGELRGIIE